jgi:putative acetyltransferase
MLTIRPEKPQDSRQVHALNEQAFGGAVEAELVDKLQEACPDVQSLVPEDDGGIVGHIFFSPVAIDDAERKTHGVGLAPMAVRPDRQRQGIGSALVGRGLEILRGRGCPFVIVVGHPDYYPRFGFEPASKHSLRSQWEGVPDEAFMVLVLDKAVMRGVSGIARYRDEFNEAM